MQDSYSLANNFVINIQPPKKCLKPVEPFLSTSFQQKFAKFNMLLIQGTAGKSIFTKNIYGYSACLHLIETLLNVIDVRLPLVRHGIISESSDWRAKKVDKILH